MAAFDDDKPFPIVLPIDSFSDENGALEDDAGWATATFTYTGGGAGANAAYPHSAFLGQEVIERDCEPFNICSGSIGKPRILGSLANTSYVG